MAWFTRFALIAFLPVATTVSIAPLRAYAQEAPGDDQDDQDDANGDDSPAPQTTPPAANEDEDDQATPPAPAAGKPVASEPAQAPAAASGNNQAALKAYIKGLDYNPRKVLATVSDAGDIIKDKDETKKEQGGKVIRCLREAHGLSANFDDVAILQPTEGVVYPGATIIVDKEMVDGKPRGLMDLKRTPINLRLDLPGLGDEGSFKIEDPTDGKVKAAINKAIQFWLDNKSDKYTNASRSNYSVTNAYSSDQVAISLGVGVKWPSGSASAGFDMDKSNESNVVAALYKQVFYTVTFDPPNSPEQFFDPSVSVEDAKQSMNDKLPPAYVSSVSYGRILLFRMETSKSVDKYAAKAALEQSFGAVNINLDAKASYDKILQNSKITVISMGGNAAAAAVANGAKSAEDLQKIIQENATFKADNPGVPIVYTIKFLKDNAVAKMGSTTDYTVENCSELNNMWIRVSISGAYVGGFNLSYDVEGGKKDKLCRDQDMQREPPEGSDQELVNAYKQWKANWDADCAKKDPLNPKWEPDVSLDHSGGVGATTKWDIPGDAKNIRLKGGCCGRDLINKILTPRDMNQCYTLTGIVTSAGINVEPDGKGATGTSCHE